jgi:hypothetical protein
VKNNSIPNKKTKFESRRLSLLKSTMKNILILKMNRLVLLTLTSIGVFVSCKPSNESKKANENENKNIVVKELKDEKSFDEQAIKIDSFVLSYGKVASSLDYSKSDGTFIHVDAHLDDKEHFLLVEEEFENPSSQEKGTKKYYFQQNKIFKTVEEFLEKEIFKIRVSYYAPNGVCLKTKEKTAADAFSIENKKFAAVPKFVCSFDKALRVLNQQKEFRITFQGFVKAKDGEYMIVGAPGKDAYTSTLRVSLQDPFIQNIKKDEFSYLNGTIYVIYEKVREINGFTYQRLVRGSWDKL